MDYRNVGDLDEIEAILGDFKIRLDGNEYDDKEEFEQVQEELSPNRWRAVDRAIELGSVPARHLLGWHLAHEDVGASIVETIAFRRLVGEDAVAYADDLRKFVSTPSPTRRSRRTSCDCIFP